MSTMTENLAQVSVTVGDQDITFPISSDAKTIEEVIA